MTDTKRETDKTLSVGKLSLKRPSVEQGVVRQSFSHGRSKAVVVETKKRRVLKPGDGKPEAEHAAPRPRAEARAEPQAEAPRAEAAPPRAGAAQPREERREARPTPAGRRGSGMVLRTLSDEEKTARQQALADARVREAEERRRAEEEARIRAEEEARLRREPEEAERRRADEEARRKAEEDAKR